MMRKTVEFQTVKINQIFFHNGLKYQKHRSDRGREFGILSSGESFPASYKVEIEVEENSTPINAQNPIDEPATSKQLSYLSYLGVIVDRPITKKFASRLIDAVKSGEGVGWAGLEFHGGGN